MNPRPYLHCHPIYGQGQNRDKQHLEVTGLKWKVMAMSNTDRKTTALTSVGRKQRNYTQNSFRELKYCIVDMNDTANHINQHAFSFMYYKYFTLKKVINIQINSKKYINIWS
jgi:hypothetical protein